ncbi:lysophosphoplipase A [Colletotrichum godetiae]|uniref:Lysophospholipase n=1 Tax=Colletotrichum godetiae TaxID=1209918 RepID=A0AAJ0EYC3_9PEZI|nr:lysophosphoplipase A [Colletotrichum godetiae]KAK1699957.1 lysophosphoplipase A [Colletotrichum godetiae]
MATRNPHYLGGVLLLAGFAAAQGQGDVDPFAPVYASCPSGLAVRSASEGLSRPEASWRVNRGEKVIPALSSYLTLANISGFDVQGYIQRLNTSSYPVVGLSVSGGGTQSGVGGLGIWQAFDARNPAAVAARTGGLTQVLSYITGLSGGGALTVSTLAANDFITISALRKQINFTVDYTLGPDGNITSYLTDIFENVGAKAETELPVSVADAFGQFWATYLPENRTYGNYSDLAQSGTVFSSGEAPMPIIALSEVIPGQSPTIGGIMWPGRNNTNGFNLTSYEVTPFEFGSWRGGRIQAFMPTMYLGTSMSNGTAQNSSECVQGFDKFTFIQGSTADAFDAWFIDDWYDTPIFAKRALKTGPPNTTVIVPPPQFEDDGRVILVNQTAESFNQTFNESLWATYPNPFENYNAAMQGIDELLLVDGSLGGETNPIRPLIIPERQVDFVIVYEASSDAQYNWVNGTNLVNTAQSAAQGNIPFPKIPDVATLVTQNLTKQPTFFGCDAAKSPPTPLVLYLPNSPWSGYSNFSFFKSSFTDNEFDLTVDNAFNLATYGNGTVDAAWPACLACATIRGSLIRAGIDLPDQCQECFRRHCWNGEVTTRTITADDLDPKLRLNSSLSFAEWNQTYWSSQTNTGGASGGGSGRSSSSGTGGTGGSGAGGGGTSSTPAASASATTSPSGASSSAELARVAAAVTVASLVALIALL